MRRHLLICGYSRAGTTLFYNMLRSTLRGLHTLDREVRASLVIGRHPESWATKRPLDIFALDEIFAANRFGKSLEMIVMLRDPRALVVSRHASVPDDYFISWDRQYFVDRGHIERSNPGIIQIHNAISAARERRDIARFTLLRFEDLVRDPAGTQTRLATELDLEFEGRFEDFHRHGVPEPLQRALNGVRPVDPTALDRWRLPEHAERVREQFDTCPPLFDLVEQYGYERDRSWMESVRESRLAAAGSLHSPAEEGSVPVP